MADTDNSFDEIDPPSGPSSGPDPELYARLSKPYPNKEAADARVASFLRDVQRAREEHCVPEVLVIAAAHFEPAADAPDEVVSIQGMAYGHPEYRAQLGAMAFNTYTLPVIQHGDALRAAAMQRHDPPVDPKGSVR